MSRSWQMLLRCYCWLIHLVRGDNECNRFCCHDYLLQLCQQFDLIYANRGKKKKKLILADHVEATDGHSDSFWFYSCPARCFLPLSTSEHPGISIWSCFPRICCAVQRNCCLIFLTSHSKGSEALRKQPGFPLFYIKKKPSSEEAFLF